MSDHPDRLRYGEDALTERHERLAKLARNIQREQRLLARLKRSRAGSEAFTDAEVAECDRIHEHWQKEIERFTKGNCDTDDIPNQIRTER